MYCPKCAREIASGEMEYCPNCGFRCREVRSMVENGEPVPATYSRSGISQGVKLLLLALILLPAFIFLNSMFPPNDRLVESSPSNTWFEQIGSAVLWTLALGGVLRILYALVFERVTTTKAKSPAAKEISSSRTSNALPPQREVPVGQWRTSGEFYEPVFAKRKTSGDLG